MRFDAGNQYDYDRLQLALEQHLKKTREWLEATYNKTSEADDTYTYMKETVDKILKRQSYCVKWNGSGSPDWHGKLYQYLSKWIKLQNEVGILTSKMFDQEEEEEEE